MARIEGALTGPTGPGAAAAVGGPVQRPTAETRGAPRPPPMPEQTPYLMPPSTT